MNIRRKCPHWQNTVGQQRKVYVVLWHLVGGGIVRVNGSSSATNAAGKGAVKYTRKRLDTKQSNSGCNVNHRGKRVGLPCVVNALQCVKVKCGNNSSVGNNRTLSQTTQW